MKKIGIVTLTLAFLFAAGTMVGQKLKSGDLSVLKGEKIINITYDYSKMAVGKFATEADYLKKGIEDRNAKKPGTGEDWAASWNAGKAEKCQPAFEEEFNDQASDCGLSVKPDPSAKYTLVLHVIFVEQGVETVVMGTAKSASLDLQIDLVETAAPDKVIANIECDGIKPKAVWKTSVGGVSVDKAAYDAMIRISQCFANAGKQVSKLVCKQLK